MTVLVLVRALVSAQDVTEPALKAAFIYNFAAFTEWPANVVPPAGPLVMCVVGDAAVGGALERTVKGRDLAGRPVAVSSVPGGSPPQSCHVLYVSGATAAAVAALVTGLRDAPVLTISDLEGFTELGGIAQFFFEHGRLRFIIRVESARHARLQISSKLLALATLK